MAAKTIQLPELGEGVTEGELVKWLVKPGDTIKADQTIAEMMTDKATVEVPSPSAGVVKELKAKEGSVVEVGQALIVLETEGAAATAAAPAKAAPAPAAATPAPAKAAPATGGGGAKTISLPELGEGVTEGELVKWLVKPGDTVKADQTIAEMMTDKATVEVPSPSAGTVKELKAKAGDVVAVGQALLVLEGGVSAAAPAPAPQAAAAAKAPAPQAQAARPATPAPTKGGGLDIHPPVAEARVLATPATRRLAREMGVDINGIQGSGVAGRVTREDVSGSGAGATKAGQPSVQPAAARAPQGLPVSGGEERVAIRGIRKKIAENMQMYKQIIPHITLGDEANITQLVKTREDLKASAEKAGVKITYLPFVVKALIATLREFPMFNASIDDKAQEIVYKKYFNIGFAADTPNGLVVPVIKNADQKTLSQIAREISELAKKARDGKLALDEMKGATMTITNIGSVGSTFATPIINHPEVAILGMYKIQEKPIIKRGPNGEIDIDVAKTMNFTATCDHRLIDGATAARFLQAFISRIENPGVLMLDMM